MKGLSVYLQVLGMALALCGLLLLGAWLMRRLRGLQNQKSSELIQIKGIKPISYKAHLVLIEVMGHHLLIGVGESGPRLLCQLEEKKDAQTTS